MKKVLKQSSRKQRGDTLIEVIFAFAILGTIIGFAFTGVIQARRSAIAAQQRTQALEIAQYQSEGLQTYRNSMLNWQATEGCPSFLGGNFGGCTNENVVGINFANPNQTYCMLTNSTVWKLTATASDCNALVPQLHVDSGTPVAIQFAKIGRLQASGTTTDADNNTVQATVTISWVDPFGHNQSVKNIVILTRQK